MFLSLIEFHERVIATVNLIKIQAGTKTEVFFIVKYEQ